MDAKEKFKPLPSQARLRELFAYDPKIGILRWRVRLWRSRAEVGDAAGTEATRGYLRVKIEGVDYYVHRIIWQMVYGGLDCETEVDHRDHVKSNNRLANLRLATHAENCLNLPARSNNTSGYPGVDWHTAAGKWSARIQREGKRVNLGLFERLEEAIVARAAASAEVFGAFAPIRSRR